jgi:hypothetical protein
MTVSSGEQVSFQESVIQDLHFSNRSLIFSFRTAGLVERVDEVFHRQAHRDDIANGAEGYRHKEDL